MSFGGFVTAIGLSDDLRKGLIDRFRSLPMARSAVLGGRTLADVATNSVSIAVMVVVGLLVGFSFSASPLRSWAASGCCCCSATPSRGSSPSSRSPELGRGRPGARLHADLPAHLRLLGVRAARSRCPPGSRRSPRPTRSPPVDAMRALWVDAPAGTTSGCAVLWCVGLIVFFAGLSVTRYRRAVSRDAPERPAAKAVALGPRLRRLELRGHAQEHVLAARGRPRAARRWEGRYRPQCSGSDMPAGRWR